MNKRDRIKTAKEFVCMRYHYGVIGATVWCDNCPWTTESHKNAQAIAKIHAKKHGHKVHGELTIAFGYDGRKETNG